MTNKTWIYLQFSENTQKKNLFFNALTPPCFARETVQRAAGYPHGNGYYANFTDQEV